MTKTKISSKIILLIAILFSLITASCWIDFRLEDKVYAEGTTSENISITNGKFDSSSSIYLQTSPTGWSSIGSAEGDVTNGVISVLPTNFDDRHISYDLTESQNPGKNSNLDDDRVLMLNSSVPSTKGYQMSSSITLNANSYYKISVLSRVFDGYGSIYLIGLENDYSENQSFSKLDSTNSHYWTEKTFYIKTGFKSENVKVQLRMGEFNKPTDGIVFFDNVSCEKLSENAFYDIYKVDSNNKLIDLYGSRTVSNFITTTNFDNAGSLEGWTAYANNTIGNKYETINIFNAEEFTGRGLDILGSDNSYNNSNALLLHNVVEGVVGVESEEFEIPVGSLYVLSLNVKLGDLEKSKGLTINLIEGNQIKDSLTEYSPKTFSIGPLSSISGDGLRNNYKTCYFLIKGNPLYNTSAKLQILLGSTTGGEIGSALIDSLNLVRVNYTEYTSMTTSTTTVSADFTSSTKTPTITNGNFNTFEVGTFNTDSIYPAIPSTWTHSGEETQNNIENWEYGVINLETTNFNSNKANYGLTTSIGTPSTHSEGESNNVIMLRNKTVSYQTLTSPSFSMPTNSYQLLSFDVRTLTPDTTLNIYVVDETNKITIYEAKDVSAVSNWTKYELQIKSSNTTQNFVVKFEFGTKDAPKSGHVFIDNVRLDASTLTAETFETFEAVSSFNKEVKKIDLSYGMYALLGNEQDGIYTLNAWETSSTTSVEDGLAGLLSQELIEELDPTLKNVIYLETFAKTDYTLSNKLPYSFASGSYYKVSMKIKTNISTPPTKYDEDGKEIENNYGLTIKLSGFENTFNFVKENEGFETYTFYLSPASTVSSNLSFTLTSTATDCLGKAYITDINIETIDETTFSLTKSLQEENKDDRTIVVATTNDDENNDETETGNASFDWLLIPSLLLSVAVVLALITFIVSKFRVKKYETQVVNEYNRESTLNKDVIRREAKNIQENEIKDCIAKIDLVKEELVQVEKEYEEMLKDRSSLSPKDKEKIFKNYASNRTKVQNKLNYLNEELENIKSEEHYLKIEKKVLLDSKIK